MRALISAILSLLAASALLAADGRPLRVAPQQEAPTWSSGIYQYDGAGNVVAMGTNGDGLSTSYAYDSLSRLTGVDVTNSVTGADVRSESYGYDRYGNINSPGG